MITTGEPFHQAGLGPVITTGEPFHLDSGRKITTQLPTPGTTTAAAEAGAFPPTPHKSPTPGINALETLRSHACCCSPVHAIPTPGPIYSHMHCILMDENYQNQNFDWGAGDPAQPSSPLRCGGGGFVAALSASCDDYQNIGEMAYLTTRTTTISTTMFKTTPLTTEVMSRMTRVATTINPQKTTTFTTSTNTW